ncbi:MAG: VWA domain-containing protein [Deltaproteobacteria bacterium]|nr:VWA domain-containing protein [Deltaproteobacteria bacterium]
MLPQFAALLQDLFAALYKYNVLPLPESSVAPSARVNRVLLDGLLASTPYEHLKARTQLDEIRAGLGAVLLGERALELLRSEKLFSRRDLLDHFALRHDEAEHAERLREIERAEEMRGDAELGEDARSEIDALRERLAREALVAERRLERRAAEVARDVANRAEAGKKRLEAEALGVAQELDDAADEAESWGRALGARGPGSAARSLELGRRLAHNPKLRKLSRLLGRMREQALALRHRLFERPSEEILDVETGRELARLLPQELIGLRHPVLRLDWRRRYVEGALLQYRLRGDDERGRGPMVVCLDTSSSMAGDKEIWSKAVALTLLDIARRERRRFRAILFSSPETGLYTLDLNRGERYAADLEGSLDLADYFAGGGTDFEHPLDAAVECLGDSRFRRGDVVLISDGECRVSEEWKRRFLAEKQRLDFSLYAILIDVGGSTLETLAELADRVSRVSELTAETAGDLFTRV